MNFLKGRRERARGGEEWNGNLGAIKMFLSHVLCFGASPARWGLQGEEDGRWKLVVVPLLPGNEGVSRTEHLFSLLFDFPPHTHTAAPLVLKMKIFSLHIDIFRRSSPWRRLSVFSRLFFGKGREGKRKSFLAKWNWWFMAKDQTNFLLTRDWGNFFPLARIKNHQSSIHGIHSICKIRRQRRSGQVQSPEVVKLQGDVMESLLAPAFVLRHIISSKVKAISQHKERKSRKTKNFPRTMIDDEKSRKKEGSMCRCEITFGEGDFCESRGFLAPLMRHKGRQKEIVSL